MAKKKIHQENKIEIRISVMFSSKQPQKKYIYTEIYISERSNKNIILRKYRKSLNNCQTHYLKQ